MTDYAWPSSIDVTSFEASLVPNVRQTTSPLGGSGQVIDLLGERWRFAVGVPQSARLGSGAQEAFFNRLKGGANRARLWHMARPIPAGTLMGAPTLNGAVAQGVNQLVLANAFPGGLKYPQAFDNAAWGKSNIAVTADAATAPDGTMTADKLIPSTAAATHYVSQTVAGLRAGETYTLSCYFRADSYTFAWMQLPPSTPFGGLSVQASFNLATSVTSAANCTSGITPVSGAAGWYFCWITATATADGSTGVRLYASGSSSSTTAGDGTSGIDVWGARLAIEGAPGDYNRYATLLAGDMIAAGDMLFQVSDDATADDTGAMTVTTVNRARKAITTGSAVTWYRPTSTFKPAETGGIVTAHSGRIVRETQVEFLEDW